jgi:hypothetical protein
MRACSLAWIFGALVVVSCQAKTEVPCLTRVDQVAAHVGKVVVLAGEVSKTKMPQILGVDVVSDSPDLRGRPATATGRLLRYEVTKEQVEAMNRMSVAHRGAGIFYQLVDPTTGHPVQVAPVTDRPR